MMYHITIKIGIFLTLCGSGHFLTKAQGSQSIKTDADVRFSDYLKTPRTTELEWLPRANGVSEKPEVQQSSNSLKEPQGGLKSHEAPRFPKGSMGRGVPWSKIPKNVPNGHGMPWFQYGPNGHQKPWSPVHQRGHNGQLMPWSQINQGGPNGRSMPWSQTPKNGPNGQGLPWPQIPQNGPNGQVLPWSLIPLNSPNGQGLPWSKIPHGHLSKQLPQTPSENIESMWAPLPLHPSGPVPSLEDISEASRNKGCWMGQTVALFLDPVTMLENVVKPHEMETGLPCKCKNPAMQTCLVFVTLDQQKA